MIMGEVNTSTIGSIEGDVPWEFSIVHVGNHGE